MDPLTNEGGFSGASWTRDYEKAGIFAARKPINQMLSVKHSAFQGRDMKLCIDKHVDPSLDMVGRSTVFQYRHWVIPSLTMPLLCNGKSIGWSRKLTPGWNHFWHV